MERTAMRKQINAFDGLRLHQEFANAGDHLGAVQLYSGHEGLMRETRLLELRTQNPPKLGCRIEQGTPDRQFPSRQPLPRCRTGCHLVATHVADLLIGSLHRPSPMIDMSTIWAEVAR